MASNTYQLRSNRRVARAVVVPKKTRHGAEKYGGWRLSPPSSALTKLFKRRRGQVLAAKEWRRCCELHAAKVEKLEAEINNLRHSWAVEMENRGEAWEKGVRRGELDASREARELYAREKFRFRKMARGIEWVEQEALEIAKELLKAAELETKIANLRRETAENEAAGLRKELAELQEPI